MSNWIPVEERGGVVWVWEHKSREYTVCRYVSGGVVMFESWRRNSLINSSVPPTWLPGPHATPHAAVLVAIEDAKARGLAHARTAVIA